MPPQHQTLRVDSAVRAKQVRHYAKRIDAASICWYTATPFRLAIVDFKVNYYYFTTVKFLIYVYWLKIKKSYVYKFQKQQKSNRLIKFFWCIFVTSRYRLYFILFYSVILIQITNSCHTDKNIVYVYLSCIFSQTFGTSLHFNLYNAIVNAASNIRYSPLIQAYVTCRSCLQFF